MPIHSLKDMGWLSGLPRGLSFSGRPLPIDAVHKGNVAGCEGEIARKSKIVTAG